VGRLRDTSEEAVERKATASFLLGVGSVGFLFLGLVSLLIGAHDPASAGGIELLVTGAVGTGVGIFLVVALAAVCFQRDWIGQWHD